LSYTRAIKRPIKKPDKDIYEHKVTLLERYEMLEDEGKIDIYYFDESGFSIASNIPYFWSPIGTTSIIKTIVAKRINLLGFLSKKGKLYSSIVDGRVNSERVVEVFDTFVETMTKPTVVVLDNASFHKSKKFKANIARWANRGLTLLYLPAYSPQLNIIETLWRFMKYIWIEHTAYFSWDNLRQYIQKICSNYGKSYYIDFN